MWTPCRSPTPLSSVSPVNELSSEHTCFFIYNEDVRSITEYIILTNDLYCWVATDWSANYFRKLLICCFIKKRRKEPKAASLNVLFIWSSLLNPETFCLWLRKTNISSKLSHLRTWTDQVWRTDLKVGKAPLEKDNCWVSFWVIKY